MILMIMMMMRRRKNIISSFNTRTGIEDSLVSTKNHLDQLQASLIVKTIDRLIFNGGSSMYSLLDRMISGRDC